MLLSYISHIIAQPSGGPYRPIQLTYDLPKDASNIYYAARSPSSFSASPNTDIQIFIDYSKIHFFDKASGNNIK